MLLHERLAQQDGSITIGELFEVTKKPRGLDLSRQAQIPFVPMDAIPQGGAFTPRYDMKPSIESGAGTYFEKCDVLVGKITPSFENGKQALVCDLPSQFGFATTEVIPLRPKSADRDRRLLFYYLLHPDIRSFVAGRMEGATGRKRVPEDVLLELPFPALGSDEEQAMSDCLSLVRLSIDIEDELGLKLTSLKRAAMRDLFTRGLWSEPQRDSEIGLVPESWDVVPLGSLGRIGNGSTPKRSVSSYWEGGTYAWLTSSKVYDREIEIADQFVTEQALSECHLPKIQPGAILIAITGQGKTLGHCAVLKIEATTNQHVAYLATDLSRADPSFVRGYIETQYDYLRQVGGGGGSTKGALTCAFLRSLPIPLPSTLVEQQEISATLDAIDAKIDLHKRKKAVLEELFRTLLHRLMTGQIRISDLDLSALQSSQEVAA